MAETSLIEQFHQDLQKEIEENKISNQATTSTREFTDLISQDFVINGKIGDYAVESFGTDDIHGFSIEEGESLSLFIADYSPTSNIQNISEQEIQELRLQAPCSHLSRR